MDDARRRSGREVERSCTHTSEGRALAHFPSSGSVEGIVFADPETAGLVGFKNFEDTNENKAFGGRIGFFPIPQLEVGYGAEWSEVEPKGSSLGSVDAFLQSADLNYTRDSDLLRGTIDARFQWAWSDVDTVTFDPDGTSGFGPLRFNNDRSGGYGQLAYRPSKLDNGFVRHLEAVVRFDALDAPGGAPAAFDEERWTIGLNYWLAPSERLRTRAHRWQGTGDHSRPRRTKSRVQEFRPSFSPINRAGRLSSFSLSPQRRIDWLL